MSVFDLLALALNVLDRCSDLQKVDRKPMSQVGNCQISRT